jgi:HSP20 family molecular chaperone IbpA
MTNLQQLLPINGSVAKIWENFFETPPFQPSRQGLSYQIRSEDDAVVAEVEVPGVDPKDVVVRVEGRAVHVETPRGNTYFTIGSRVDVDHVTASIRHGLLSLRVPKREARTVEVKVEVEGQES